MLQIIDGIGIVYAIALLYFITKGSHPIYDRFAHIALLKIDGETSFEELISNKEFYEHFRDGCSVDTVISDYEKYQEKMREVFGKRLENGRDVDRTLWTYGHLFNCVPSNQKRKVVK